MKRIITTGSIFLALLIFIFINTSNVNAISKDVRGYLDETENYIFLSDYKNASLSFEDAYDCWNENKSYLGIVTLHSELDDITTTFESACILLRVKEYDHFMSALYSIRSKISSIEQKERINSQNLF